MADLVAALFVIYLMWRGCKDAFLYMGGSLFFYIEDKVSRIRFLRRWRVCPELDSKLMSIEARPIEQLGNLDAEINAARSRLVKPYVHK